MQWPTKVFLITIIVIVLCAISFVAWSIWQYNTVEGYRSCLASLSDKVVRQKQARDWMAENKDWKILNETEVDSLMQDLKGGDCSRRDDLSRDPWNNKLNIALRTQTEATMGIIIWSNGPDGAYRTGDEMVYPYESEIPR
jgi:hypothetical protein